MKDEGSGRFGAANKSNLTLAILVIGLAASATIFQEFLGWKPLVEYSPEIVIAKCIPTVNVTTNKPMPTTDSLNRVSIDVVSVLKGGTKPGISRLLTWYETKPGEYYLLFAQYPESYHAYEEYRVIPIGKQFNTNDLSGKTLSAQIRMLLQRRLDDLSAHTKQEEEEVRRLEAGLIELTK